MGNEGVNLLDYFVLGGPNGQTVASVYDSPATLVNLIVRNLFVFGGIILFLLMFYAGAKFITQGTKGKDEAKTIFTTAITGFIIMFVAYWLVQIIGLITGADILMQIS